MLLVFAVICAVVVESRYPYDDAYVPGDIVPKRPIVRDPYDMGGYQGNKRPGYGDTIKRRNNGYGRQNEDALLNRDYRRRNREYGSYLPPRGIGGHQRRPYDRPNRPDYDYESRRRPIDRPPKHHGDYDSSYGGGYKIPGIRFN